MACESGMATWAGFASLPGPCRPLGRLRSRSSDTWMPRDHGTTSISGFPQPVKPWHMVISILCVDVCIRGILQYQLHGQGFSCGPSYNGCTTVGPLDFCGPMLAELPGTSTVPAGTSFGWQADRLVRCLQLCCR